ncbi:MAG TPA: SAM-dependent methyltransferase [Polyangiaceae bacterium]|nr:SAM-dependent methyltransferase [Polyangiaceae bacterium]
MNRERNFTDRGEPLLTELVERIDEGGPITFAEYMNRVLYHPILGYYAQTRSPIGTRADYFTSVSATRLFGRIIARVARYWRNVLGEPFAVYEFGAHKGQLRLDVLSEAPELEMHGFEFSDQTPPTMRGLVFSNELLDALPFHRVKVQSGQWLEQYVNVVTRDPVRLDWQLGPLSSDALAQELEPLPRHLMEGYETEVSLEAKGWLENVAARLSSGVIVSIDYGFDLPEYFAPQRQRGGLRCYRQHKRTDDPFQHPGTTDITCDVNFGSLIELGERLGLTFVEFTDQSRYLMRSGQELIREIIERDAGQLSRERNEIHTLTHPQFLGNKFKVLVQRK